MTTEISVMYGSEKVEVEDVTGGVSVDART